mmetsp:Transcript_25694/g.73865  ORF Transcript_25694/g.73865 Transcript_25694/m.73865 type:complete len:231 (-) Transcript_25694:39-731(-)
MPVWRAAEPMPLWLLGRNLGGTSVLAPFLARRCPALPQPSPECSPRLLEGIGEKLLPAGVPVCLDCPPDGILRRSSVEPGDGSMHCCEVCPKLGDGLLNACNCASQRLQLLRMVRHIQVERSELLIRLSSLPRLWSPRAAAEDRLALRPSCRKLPKLSGKAALLLRNCMEAIFERALPQTDAGLLARSSRWRQLTEGGLDMSVHLLLHPQAQAHEARRHCIGMSAGKHLR